MEQKKLEAAREFITEKQYDVARTILEALPNDKTAQSWLAKLNEIAPKPRDLKEMTDEELILLLDRYDVFGELIQRIDERLKGKWHSDESEAYKKQLSALTYRLIAYLETQKYCNVYSWTNVIKVLTYALQEVSKLDRELPGATAFDELDKLTAHQDLVSIDHIMTLVRNINTLRARIIVFNMYSGYNVTWSIPEKFVPRTSMKVVELSQQGRTILAANIEQHVSKKGHKKFAMQWNPETALKEHENISSIVIEVAHVILEQLTEDAENEYDLKMLEREGYKTYNEDIAPYIDDDESNDDFEDMLDYEIPDDDYKDYDGE